MKHVLLFMIIFASVSRALSQNATELIYEDFENTSLDWNEVERDDHIRVVKNGKLNVAVAAKTYFWCGQHVMPDKKQSWSMETEITFTKFKTGEAGLMWGGGSDKEKMYFFLLSPNGAWNYGVWSPLFNSITGSQKTPHVNKGLATNKLKVEKAGSKLRLYVNDVLVHETRFPSTKGTLMGFVNGGGVNTIEADYFKVSEIIEAN